MATGTKYYELFDTNSKSTKLISGSALIAEEIRILVSIQKYSLFFGNNIGLGVNKYLFLSNKLATFNLIKADIEKLFSKYKRAQLLKTEMVFDELTNTLVITLTVTTNLYNKNTFNVLFTLNT
jgi:hypothetical protein